ncbi:hypothetical protein Zmor_014710 [Zophobas morio]|uniref:Uncharacterized protein n=1 Tax=Zophobas morio TaxID=2755281 RepID=A0AA38IKR3_9CUCU|nr:hypothetical protein Zmor_014710 [Zophobas morio]
MGYKYKMENNKKILLERPYIKTLKLKFLKTYLRYQEDYPNVKFVFLDETWIYKNGCLIQTWVNDNLPTLDYKLRNLDGNRFTVLHAGCFSGFLDGCGLLLRSKNNVRDYHKTMDGARFKESMQNQLIPALEFGVQNCDCVR